MTFGRTILVLILAVAWCSGAWHEDLEAAGLLEEHVHHHGATAHGHANHAHDAPAAPDESGEHDPFWARHGLKDMVIALAGPLLLGTLLLFALVVAGAGMHAVDRAPAWRFRSHPPDQDTIWHFLRRCAPLAAAPPVA